MNYRDTLQYLYARLPMYQRTGGAALKYNLDNTLALMRALGNPHRQLRVVHVAGTNGKGSVSHTVAAVLQAAGYRTGLYTSPHLKSFTERIRLNGREIPPAAVTAFVERIRPLVEELNPSFFELTFALAMDYFAGQGAEVAVVEVGMGGRLDSTNVVQPVLTVITNISYDHQQFLGDTLPAIASEKAGIIKPGVPVLISENQPEVEPVFRNRAREQAAPLYFAGDFVRLEQAPGNRLHAIIEEQLAYEGLHPDLQGPCREVNLRGALAALYLLRKTAGLVLPDQAVYEGVSRVAALTGLKGRWQILHRQPLVIADTAHNEAGIRQVVRALEETPHRQLHVVWGMVKDKQADKLLRLLPAKAHYYWVQPAIPRALPAEDLQAAARQAGLSGEVLGEVMAGYATARQAAGDQDLVFVGGSTFVVAELEDL